MKRYLMYSTGCLFTDKQTGGTKRFIELTRYLQQKDLADLCCQDEECVLSENNLKRTYVFKKEEYGFLPPEIGRVFANLKLIRDIKKKSYEGIISFDVPPTLALSVFNFKNIILMIRKDLIGYENVINNESKKKKIRDLVLKVSEGICLYSAQKIIVQCEYDKEQLISRHNLIKSKIEKKIFVQINNVNPSWIVEKSMGVEECSSNTFKVGFIGNFNDVRKGHDILLEAAKSIHNNVEDICFEIIGDGKDLEKYKKEYDEEYITFHGRQENPINILKSCKVLVVPSRADSCPNTVMEALYNGIVVIGAKRGGIPEILNHTDALFELSPIEISELVKVLYKSEEKYEALKNWEKTRKEELTFDWAEKIWDIINIELL